MILRQNDGYYHIGKVKIHWLCMFVIVIASMALGAFLVRYFVICGLAVMLLPYMTFSAMERFYRGKDKPIRNKKQ